MSYLASIYACLLALFGALALWALPMVLYATIDSLRAVFRKRITARRPAQLPAAGGLIRRSEVSIH